MATDWMSPSLNGAEDFISVGNHCDWISSSSTAQTVRILRWSKSRRKWVVQDLDGGQSYVDNESLHPLFSATLSFKENRRSSGTNEVSWCKLPRLRTCSLKKLFHKFWNISARKQQLVVQIQNAFDIPDLYLFCNNNIGELLTLYDAWSSTWLGTKRMNFFGHYRSLKTCVWKYSTTYVLHLEKSLGILMLRKEPQGEEFQIILNITDVIHERKTLIEKVLHQWQRRHHVSHPFPIVLNKLICSFISH